MSELVAKTSAAIAVGENLTTLIDWVNIETVAGFTIAIKNDGGGSGHSITDVTIDTSNDGGATASLDQHDGVPLMPIPATKASIGGFTQTAKFIRVRAVCAAGQDTTASAILTAESCTGRICTLLDVKNRLGITVTGYDEVINRAILGLESIFDSETHRSLIAAAADVTEYYTVQGPLLQLMRYPLISITSIKEAYDYDFDSATALVADTDYRIVAGGRRGILNRCWMQWANGRDAIQVIYRGGYCSAGQTPGTGEYALPADLREAAIEQASFIFKRRDDIGLTGVGFEGGSINKFSTMDLLPMVRQVLDSYRRPQL